MPEATIDRLEKAVPTLGWVHLHDCIYHDLPFQCMNQGCEKVPDQTGKRIIYQPFGVCQACRKVWG